MLEECSANQSHLGASETWNPELCHGQGSAFSASLHPQGLTCLLGTEEYLMKTQWPPVSLGVSWDSLHPIIRGPSLFPVSVNVGFLRDLREGMYYVQLFILTATIGLLLPLPKPVPHACVPTVTVQGDQEICLSHFLPSGVTILNTHNRKRGLLWLKVSVSSFHGLLVPRQKEHCFWSALSEGGKLLTS